MLCRHATSPWSEPGNNPNGRVKAALWYSLRNAVVPCYSYRGTGLRTSGGRTTGKVCSLIPGGTGARKHARQSGDFDLR